MSDVSDLVRLANLKKEVEDMTLDAVRSLRHKGVSWYKIGPALGVTRQAAEQKYKKRVG